MSEDTSCHNVDCFQTAQMTCQTCENQYCYGHAKHEGGHAGPE
jgi:hypothetical protein